MSAHEADLVFEGAIPALYDRLLVPLIFDPYATDLVARTRALAPKSVLEVAAGTGVVTRAMAEGLDDSVSIVGTDLNQPMLDHAALVGTVRPVDWRQADVMDLPFADASFDVVVCQFGVMFFPDRPGAFAEVRRVLRPGGAFLFNTWDRIENNDFADTVTNAVGEMFPDDPPRFLARTPHGYFDEEVVRAEVSAGGYNGPVYFESVEARSTAPTNVEPAVAYCQGTPLRDEIEARDPEGLVEATAVSAEAIAGRFGRTAIDGKLSGFVVTATKS